MEKILETPAVNYKVPELFDGLTEIRVVDSIYRFHFYKLILFKKQIILSKINFLMNYKDYSMFNLWNRFTSYISSISVLKVLNLALTLIRQRRKTLSNLKDYNLFQKNEVVF